MIWRPPAVQQVCTAGSLWPTLEPPRLGSPPSPATQGSGPLRWATWLRVHEPPQYLAHRQCTGTIVRPPLPPAISATQPTDDLTPLLLLLLHTLQHFNMEGRKEGLHPDQPLRLKRENGLSRKAGAVRSNTDHWFQRTSWETTARPLCPPAMSAQQNTEMYTSTSELDIGNHNAL